MTFYISTPIYYVNDVPHLGHAYTTIVADAFARFHRMRGEPTRMLTGTDEHGQKVEEAALKRGVTPRQHVDDVAPRFAHTWRRLGIANDDFIRTTEDRHRRICGALWRRMADRGDLYLASYEGWYCVGCEGFYTESTLTKDGDSYLCPTHKRPVAWVAKERTWFFRLSAHQQALLDHIEAHPGFIQPEAYRNEVVSFIKSGLRDLSVSRTSFTWGIPIPDPDPEGHQHVMYVWLDALTNYLSALADPDAENPFASDLVRTFWPHATHLIGKDILRFHAVYWPCFLLAAGLPLPKTILCHGWWTVRGEKISKSMPATRIDPVQLARALAGDLAGAQALEGGAASSSAESPLLPGSGVDAMRYYLLREVPLGNDGDFTFESLFARYNADLANDLGNLVNRTTTLAEGQRVQLSAARCDEPRTAALLRVAGEAVSEAEQALAGFAPHRALEAIWRLVREGNRYVDACEPWKLKKAAAQPGASEAADELAHVLGALHHALSITAALVYPVLPHSSAAIRAALGGDPGVPSWPVAAPALAERTAKKSVPLFPRLDAAAQDAIVAALVPDALAPATPAAAAPTTPAPAAAAVAQAAGAELLPFETFAKVELRVGQIKTATAVPKAKKLLHLTVDLGEAAPRSIVAGIAEAFAPETLLGKKVIVVANLAPATIRGLRSEGMILAAGDEAILGLSAVDADVPPGTRVR